MSLPTTLPEPVIPRLVGGPTLRWGVLAPGFIAGVFASTLHRNTDQRIAAVASRSAERAETFARSHGIDRSYDDYRALVDDPGIDIVYVAAPHTEHLALATLALEAGKHVLVEKPIAASADEARRIAEAARAAGRFAMEAMHTRFHPRMTVIERLLADGALGELRLVQAELGLGNVPVDPTSRLYDPALGGGAALDLGVYPLWFHDFVLGAPTRLDVSGTLAVTGVEDQWNATLHHDDGATGEIAATMRTWTPSHAAIGGAEGRIHLDSRHPQPGGFTVYDVRNQPVSRFDDETGVVGTDGLCRQAAWAAQHIADGLLESPLHPLATSIRVLETVDGVRAGLGAAPIGEDAA
ncbi:Gfo/Idh/MocA family oxidoreductase [Protaetiibacter sp. SSC-01]|uniref:Gfo/Idh/MocA family protein n=1 Tax=Protaetiibacter sp. SSC-01 TaxID=2759943 RepID=UPI0016570E45|nr:Gfo/Idh/MocA family oxidoreductase [Protaetiibacter sp. SSC-01]QNO36898.1 Gfo/Idh/MocA family oxidoreductase [Protaetiibacter sp. SSC-01]